MAFHLPLTKDLLVYNIDNTCIYYLYCHGPYPDGRYPDYVGVSGFPLEFQVGNKTICHTIYLVNDTKCEGSPPEDFSSKLELGSGRGIDIIRDTARVLIVDEIEPECGEL